MGAPEFLDENLKKNQIIIDLIDKISKEKNATIAQISLAWVLAQKDFIVPIPETTKLHHLKENIEAEKIEFSEEELELLNRALNELYIVKGRYAPGSDYEKRIGL